MDEKYYVLKTKNPNQKIPFKINNKGRVSLECACEIVKLNSAREGHKRYAIKLDSDGDISRYEKNLLGQRERIAVLSVSPVKYHLKINYPVFNSSNCTWVNLHQVVDIMLHVKFPRVALNEVSQKNWEEIKSGRSLRAAARFAYAHTHRR